MRTIKIGCTGDDVAMMKESLRRLGYTTAAGNVFTEADKPVVMQFQHNNGLGADGIVGFMTWERLLFNGKPASAKLTDEDFSLVARLLDCEAAAIKAVQAVETGGKGGFLTAGKPMILFEGHCFWKQLVERKYDPNKYVKGNEDILYKTWTKAHYKGGLGEYGRLEKARKINRDAADASASWGMFQVMGFNHNACGEKSVASFVASMCESERKQLLLTARFIHNNMKMSAALAKKDWATFARLYNGPMYSSNSYDKKLKMAYEKYK